jgi:3-polyprenyl-4-hydroxybenzoate decarboxylase
MVNQTVSRVLDVLGLPQADVQRWSGLPQEQAPLSSLS